jgi:hypothetical protein
MANTAAFLKRVMVAGALAVAAGCASVAHTPATLQGASASETPRSLARPLQIALDSGFHRTIAAGSQWQRAGSIEQGIVYKPYRDVFTVEGAHIHEAYLVVDKDTLVGFYLPAERGFSPLKQQSTITFQ